MKNYVSFYFKLVWKKNLVQLTKNIEFTITDSDDDTAYTVHIHLPFHPNIYTHKIYSITMHPKSCNIQNDYSFYASNMLDFALNCDSLAPIAYSIHVIAMHFIILMQCSPMVCYYFQWVLLAYNASSYHYRTNEDIGKYTYIHEIVARLPGEPMRIHWCEKTSNVNLKIYEHTLTFTHKYEVNPIQSFKVRLERKE